jgi:hypothetical protein
MRERNEHEMEQEIGDRAAELLAMAVYVSIFITASCEGERGPRRLFLDADRAHWSAADAAARGHCSGAGAGAGAAGATVAGKNCWVTAAAVLVGTPGTGKPKIILVPSSGRRSACSSSSATARAMPSTAPWKDLLVAAMAVRAARYSHRYTQAHGVHGSRLSLCDGMHHWNFSFCAVR